MYPICNVSLGPSICSTREANMIICQDGVNHNLNNPYVSLKAPETQISHNGKIYTEMSYELKINTAARVLKIIQVIALVIFSCFIALAFQSIRKLWCEAIKGTQSLDEPKGGTAAEDTLKTVTPDIEAQGTIVADLGTSLNCDRDLPDSISKLKEKSKEILFIKTREQDGVDLEEVDLYTSQTFNILKEENKEKGLPYFIVTWKSGDCKRYADAASFIRSFFRFNNITDPLSRIEIHSYKIYKISPKNNFFKFFCDETILQQKMEATQSHNSKYIGACNTEKTESRGEKRYYMSAYNTQRAEDNPDKATKYYEKANFWLNLALEDGHDKALIEQVCWLWEGNSAVSQDKDKALTLMRDHIHKLTMDTDDDCALVDIYFELLNEHTPDNNDEIMFCSTLLSRKKN